MNRKVLEQEVARQNPVPEWKMRRFQSVGAKIVEASGIEQRQ